MAFTMFENFVKLIDLFLILECIFGAAVKDDLDRVNLKRLSINPLTYYPEEIRQFLPASSEINTTNRFSLSGLRHADLDKISQLSKNHTICLGCHMSTISLMHHECRNDVIICNAGSVCMNASIVADIQHIHDPQAITSQAGSYPYKGCCNHSDVHCRSTMRSVHTCPTTSNCTRRGYYEIAVCKGSLCNFHVKDYSERDISEIAALRSALPPVNGGWSTWGSWGHCPPCRVGTRSRHRQCTNPVPSMGGADCIGSSSERESCVGQCHVNGGWSSWGAWSQCACATGTWSRQRECNNPAPASGGSSCVGTRIEESSCRDQCPVNGGWSSWGAWSQCACATGTWSRRRECNNPAPASGGSSCVGTRIEESSCRDQCPVNGGWSSWGAWSQCACATGTWSRRRECNNPAPASGGSSCVGTRIEESSCRDQCPVNGGWSSWGAWSQCACATGTWSRRRECNNPAPASGGSSCVGTRIEESSCRDQCPVNGNWGTWGTWNTCMCNTLTQNRSRECNNPVPSRGGADCVGFRYEQSPCTDDCPECNNSVPARGGVDCIGIPHEQSLCADKYSGQWTAWNTWMDCSSTCGEGVWIRLRQCLLSDNITKTNNCPGASIESESCRNIPCPTTTPVPTTVLTTTPSTTTTEGPGVWTEWTQWSGCSTHCGSGFRYIARFCIDPRTEIEKHDCPGLAVDSVSCEVNFCPVDGSWSEWNGWGPCHGGLQSRSRECNNPSPLYNGTDCQGNKVDVTNCIEEITVSPLVQLVPPEIFGATESNVGGNITLLCLTSVSGLNVTWFYQERDSLPLGARQPTGTNELIITGVDSKNYGKYTCTLSESSKTVQNQVFINLHESAPVILSLIKSPDTVVEGSPVKLKCDVLAFPDPVIRWGYKDRSGNAYVPPPVSYKDGGKEIDIDSFQSMLYGGTWTCNAINKLGSDHRDIIV